MFKWYYSQFKKTENSLSEIKKTPFLQREFLYIRNNFKLLLFLQVQQLRLAVLPIALSVRFHQLIF